jgi:acetylornithine deacetylase
MLEYSAGQLDIAAKSAETSWTDALGLLRNLVQKHPTYGSEGLMEGMSEIARFLERAGCDRVEIDDFAASDIQHSPLYVPVETFSSIYADYKQVPKRNVLATIDSGLPGPTLVLNGHVDVDIVSNPELWSETNGWRSGTIRGGRLWGRGSTDMLGGLVALLHCFAELSRERSSWRGKVLLTAVCDEEVGGNGTLRALEILKARGDLDGEDVIALIAEPSDGLVCCRSLGFFPFKVCLQRPTIHMGLATRTHSLFDDLIRIERDLTDGLIQALRGRLGRLSSADFRSCMGVVQGGVDPALPLGTLSLEGTIFCPVEVTQKLLSDALPIVIRGLIREGTESSIALGDLCFEGSECKEVTFARTLVDTAEGEAIGLGLFPSPCDARLFDQYGIDCVVYGPGSLSDAHSIDESISLDSLRCYADHIVRAVKTFMTRCPV